MEDQYTLENIKDELETSGYLYCKCGKCIAQHIDFDYDLPVKQEFSCVCGKTYFVQSEDHMIYEIWEEQK